MEGLDITPKLCLTHPNDCENIDYVLGIGQMLNQLRNKQLLCDAIIDVEKQNFHVHQCILAATSPYFQEMFTKNLASASDNNVRLKNATISGFQEVLHFAYTGHATLCEENVKDVLSSAEQYGYPALEELCLEYMTTNISPSNCLQLIGLAEKYDAPDFHEKADSIALKNFNTISKAPQFMDLSEERLCRYISSDNLENTCELDVFHVVYSWLKHKPDRLHIAHNLIKYIRFHLIAPEDLTEHVFNCDIIRQDKLCLDLLLGHLAQGQGNMDQSSRYRLYTVASQALSQSLYPEKIFIFGGDVDIVKFHAATFTENSNNWAFQELNLPGQSCKGIATMFNFQNTLVILTSERFGRICGYDINSNTWKRLASMPDGRIDCATTLLNDCLILVGGTYPAILQHQRKVISSSIQYNLTNNTWEVFPSFPHPTDFAAACAYQGTMYISRRVSQNSASSEMYACQPAAKEWIKLAPPPVNHSHFYGHSGKIKHHMVNIGSNIYVISGNHGSMYSYSPPDDQWTSLSGGGGGVGHVCVHQDVIYTVGTCTRHSLGNCCLTTFELDHEKGTMQCETELPFRLCHSFCCI